METVGNTKGAGSTGESVGELTEQLLFLLPEEVNIPAELDVRPYSSNIGPTEKETEALTNLMNAILEEGQIQPVKVRYNADGGYDLVAGRRRHMAVMMINAAKEEKEAPLRLKAMVERVEETNPKKLEAQGYRQAMMENLHREDMSPMDVAMDMKNLRGKFKGSVTEVTKKIAGYLCVSPATVMQYGKLLDLEPDIQEQVHAGKISRDAAFVLAGIDKDKRGEVIQKAEQKQEAEKEKVQSEGLPGNKSKDTGTLKTRHIKEAARETEGATKKNSSRSKKEIVEFFESLDGPISGDKDSKARVFILGVSDYAAGKIGDNKLQKLWLDLIGADTTAKTKAAGKPAPKSSPKQNTVAKSAAKAGSKPASKPVAKSEPKKAAKK